jgi:hypothetical protein
VFGQNPISDTINSVIAYLPKVFVAIVIVVVASAVAAAVKDIVENSLSGLSYGRGLATAASTLIVVVGAFAALNQLEIAPAIVTGLFYAMLAIVVGSAVIAIGGAGVFEMRPYVRRALERVDDEASNVKAEAKSDTGDETEIDITSGQRRRPLTADDAVGAGNGPARRPRTTDQFVAVPRWCSGLRARCSPTGTRSWLMKSVGIHTSPWTDRYTTCHWWYP